MQHVPGSIENAALVTWTPDGRRAEQAYANLPMLTAIRRGAAGHCPACGSGRLFSTWLGIVPACANCGAPLGSISADDAPPYFTVFIVAHLVIGLQIALDRSVTLSVVTEMMIFLPGTVLLTLALIRPVKGATVGLMLKLGFMKQDEMKQAGVMPEGADDA
jgi:uncharacterized protein (DUF983 family)